MSPQFVDFDADGILDIVTGTFDGSPHVAYGTKSGFKEPTHLLDSKGRRILLSQYWDYDEKKWTNADRSPAGEKNPDDHCISAVAFDWDADGDLDLLLGDYGKGHLYRQMNEGEPGAPSFTGENVPVMVDGEPFALDGKLTAPRLVDWNGDGLMDLVCGSFGNSWGGNPPGGVYLFLNEGERGAPDFAPAETLIEPARNAGTRAERPDTGLYVDPVDYDGDGDLDLLVGGYSNWKPEARELTPEVEARADVLVAVIARAREVTNALIQGFNEKSAHLEDAERDELFRKLTQSTEYKEQRELIRESQEELDELRPRDKREAAVWLYRRSDA